MFDYQAGSTPLEARGSFPIGIFFLILFIIVIILGVIYFIIKKRQDYLKSDKYKEKEKNRPTTRKDIKLIEKEHGLLPEQGQMLWEICEMTQTKNILFQLKDNNDITQLFQSAYNTFKNNKTSDEKIYQFFSLLYKLETIVAKNKALTNTRFIPVSSIIFYLSSNGEQHPFPMVYNKPDGFFLEIPQFLYSSPHKPKILTRTRFIYKTKLGLSYNIVARVIRYDVSNQDQYLMVVGHSENIESQVQRHFKRDYTERQCAFSPVRIDRTNGSGKDTFIYSTKKYTGKITNLSAGGCCFQTDLGIKEGQHLRIIIPDVGIKENIIGVIKKTRKEQIMGFSIHIQFVRISLQAQNRISSLVYRFEL